MKTTTWLIDNANYMFRKQENAVEQFFDICLPDEDIVLSPQIITIQVIKECKLVTNVIDAHRAGDPEAHSYVARSYKLAIHQHTGTFHVLWDLHTDVLFIHFNDKYVLKDTYMCFNSIDNFKSILFQIVEAWYKYLDMPKSYPYRRDMHRYWKLLSPDDSILEEQYLPPTFALNAKLNKNVSDETLELVADYAQHVWRNMPKLSINRVAECKTFKQLIDLGASNARHTWYKPTATSYRQALKTAEAVQCTCCNALWYDLVELCR